MGKPVLQEGQGHLSGPSRGHNRQMDRLHVGNVLGLAFIEIGIAHAAPAVIVGFQPLGLVAAFQECPSSA